MSCPRSKVSTAAVPSSSSAKTYHWSPSPNEWPNSPIRRSLMAKYRSAFRNLLRLLAVNSSGNAHVLGRMLKKKNIDDLRIGPDRLVSNFNDVADQLRLAGLRKTGGDMTLDVGHSCLRFLLQTSNQFFVI